MKNKDMEKWLNKIIQGDCLEYIKILPENSVDAIVTDPPYGLSFMGKKWDYEVPSVEIWKEALRVLKPGGYLLSFAGTRTQHRMACNIEDAGFEIRDMIAWIYGSGFPKSLNIGKQKDCEEWEGWGTALKPALEPITVARKPLSEKTVAENVLKWGTGGINIDGSRVGTEERENHQAGFIRRGRTDEEVFNSVDKNKPEGTLSVSGRFPANLIHDGSGEVVSLFPNTKGPWGNKKSLAHTAMFNAPMERKLDNAKWQSDGESASRFFYCAKASKSERNRGCEGMEEKAGIRTNAPRENEDVKTPLNKNNHPTVKPIALMEYLVKLVSREGAIVLDPFAGSGSTLIACKNLKRNYIGCELDPGYVKIAEARIKSIDDTLF